MDVKVTSHADLINMLLKEQGVEVPVSQPKPKKKTVPDKKQQEEEEEEKEEEKTKAQGLRPWEDDLLKMAVPDNEVGSLAAPTIELPTIPTVAPTAAPVLRKVAPKKVAPKKVATPAPTQAPPPATMFSLHMFSNNAPAPKKKTVAHRALPGR